MTDKLKKQLILNLPYLIFVYLFDKLCQGVRLAQPLSEKAALNPDWVEWLMGFPKGWTAVSSGERNPQMSPA